LWEDFRIESATSELPGFQWSTEPLATDALPVGDLEASSAWRLNIMMIGEKVGDYSGKVKLQVTPLSGGESVERELVVKGRVRAAISFAGRSLNSEKGLDLGLIRRGKEFKRSLIVRVRDETGHRMDVLDVKPKSLRATLETTKVPGAYRLTLVVPADSQVEMFDREEQHGYVQVGDPENQAFHNWLPLYGAIVNPATIISIAELYRSETILKFKNRC